MGLVEPAKAGVGVGLHQSGIARQMLLRMRTATIGRVEEHGRRRIWARKRTVVAHVGPELAGPGLTLGQDGTVASSAWRRSVAKTWLRIASTRGIRVAEERQSLASRKVRFMTIELSGIVGEEFFNESSSRKPSRAMLPVLPSLLSTRRFMLSQGRKALVSRHR